MIAIALTALAMFGLGLRVWLEVAAFGHRGVKLSELPRWLEQAHLREGRVGDLVFDFASCDSLDAVESRLASVQASQIRPLGRELKLMKVCARGPTAWLAGHGHRHAHDLRGPVRRFGRRPDDEPRSPAGFPKRW